MRRIDQNADGSPIDYVKELSNQSRELAKAMLNRSKQEIYANKPTDHLLPQGSIQEGKKQDEKKEDMWDSWPDRVFSSFQNWESKDGEHYDYNGDQSGGNKFNLHDAFQEEKSKQDENNDMLHDWPQGVDSSFQNREFRKDSEHYGYYGDQSGGNKFDSDIRELRKSGGLYDYFSDRSGVNKFISDGMVNVQGTRNHLAGSPAMSAARKDQHLPEFRNDNDYYGFQGGGHKFNSDETTNVQGTLNYLAGSPTMPAARRDQRLPEFRNDNDYHGVRGGGYKFNSDETNMQGTHSHLAGNEMHNPMSSARRDQLLEAARRNRLLVINQNLGNDDYGGSRLLYEEDNYKNDESYQVQRRLFEHNRAKDHSAPAVTGFQKLSIEKEENKPVLIIPDHLQVKTPELQHLTFGSFGSEMNRSIQPNGLPSQFLNGDSKYIHHSSEFADDLSLKHLYTRDAESSEEEDQRLRRNAANEEMANTICFDAAQNDHSTSNFNQIEPAQENHYKSSSVTDFTFDTSHWLNQELDPSEPSPQMQNVLDQHAYKREPYFQSAKDTILSMLASPLGRKPSNSMAEALKTATSYVPLKYREAKSHHKSQPEAPSRHYSNMMNSPYNRSSSTLQQHGGSSNNNTFRHQSLPAMPPQYRNSNLPQSALNIVPSTYGYQNQQCQQQQEEQPYTAFLNQQNTRKDPSNQAQQQSRGRYNY